MYADRVACCPLVSHVGYAPPAVCMELIGFVASAKGVRRAYS